MKQGPLSVLVYFLSKPAAPDGLSTAVMGVASVNGEGREELHGEVRAHQKDGWRLVDSAEIEATAMQCSACLYSQDELWFTTAVVTHGTETPRFDAIDPTLWPVTHMAHFISAPSRDAAIFAMRDVVRQKFPNAPDVDVEAKPISPNTLRLAVFS